MTGTVLLTLVATVSSVDGGLLRLDKGLVDGLRRGDVGRIAYELRVGSDRRTIEVARGVVVETSGTEARLELDGNRNVHPGYVVRFAIPVERTTAAALLNGLAEIPEGEDPAAALLLWLDRQIPRDPRIEDGLLALLQDRLGRRVTVPQGGFEPPEVRIESGVYQVGADALLATHHNQRPSFLVHLAPFWIDRSVAEANFGLSYDEAEAACQFRGTRLPTEFEWEVAATHPDALELSPLYEWTNSWYLPYPGNAYREQAYGKKYRVLRGSADPASTSLRTRRFVVPTTELSSIGFRCVRSDP